MTITLKHEKSTRNYELYKSANPIANIYIPKEEFNGRTAPSSITVSITIPPAA